MLSPYSHNITCDKCSRRINHSVAAYNLAQSVFEVHCHCHGQVDTITIPVKNGLFSALKPVRGRVFMKDGSPPQIEGHNPPAAFVGPQKGLVTKVPQTELWDMDDSADEALSSTFCTVPQDKVKGAALPGGDSSVAEETSVNNKQDQWLTMKG